MWSTKDAKVRDVTVGIAADYDKVLEFLQAVALKAPQVLAAPLSLIADKCTTSLFHQWADCNLK